MRVALAKIHSYATWDLPEQGDTYDSHLYQSQMLRDMALDIVDLVDKIDRMKAEISDLRQKIVGDSTW